MEKVWTFMQTMGKGIVQGTKQYLNNDLKDQLPLIIFAAVLIAAVLLKRYYKKNKKQIKQ